MEEYKNVSNNETYGFDFLTDRIYNLLDNQTKKKKNVQIPVPIVSKFGGRKSIFSNCDNICIKINRELPHVFKYICTELSINGSINEDRQIIMKGKFFSKNLSTIISSYINKYVMCDVCDSFDTNMMTEDGIVYLDCKSCLAKNSIQNPIK